MAAEVAAACGYSRDEVLDMNLPWLGMIYASIQASECRRTASIIQAVNLGYCGSRNKDSARAMREAIQGLSAQT